MDSDLSEVPLLKGVKPASLALLFGKTHWFKQGEPIIVRGDEPKHIVIIRSGEVAVRVHGVHLVTRKRDDILGEQAFINKKPHSADCVAVSPVQAVCMPAEVADVFLQDEAFVQNLLEDISEKLRESTSERYVRYGTAQRLFAEFRSHLSDEVLRDLLEKGEDYGAPRHVDNVAVMFCDIRGFTRYVQEAGPDKSSEVADELSAYLASVTSVIHQKHGFVDKFIGDGVLAFWAYPGIERPSNDKILACAAELIAIARLHTFGGKPAKIGIGINQGACFMGNVGGEEKRQFTILGDAVNIASRLEPKTKDFDADIVVGEPFFDGLSAEQQERFTVHHDIKVRGVGTCSLYSLSIEVQ